MSYYTLGRSLCVGTRACLTNMGTAVTVYICLRIHMRPARVRVSLFSRGLIS
jgi:hypothetical protein